MDVPNISRRSILSGIAGLIAVPAATAGMANSSVLGALHREYLAADNAWREACEAADQADDATEAEMPPCPVILRRNLPFSVPPLAELTSDDIRERFAMMRRHYVSTLRPADWDRRERETLAAHEAWLRQRAQVVARHQAEHFHRMAVAAWERRTAALDALLSHPGDILPKA